VLERAIADRWPAVHVSHELLTADVARQLRASGTSIGVWTVNELADIQRVVRLGIEMLITDEPERARDATDRLRSGR
jgi:glycerophosphoryl diester phosphodiesterase